MQSLLYDFFAFIGFAIVLLALWNIARKAKRAYQRWLVGPPDAWLSVFTPEWRFHEEIRAEMEEHTKSLIKLDILYEDLSRFGGKDSPSTR